jgi:hypothetical protein
MPPSHACRDLGPPATPGRAWVRALAVVMTAMALEGMAATLSEKAKESGCIGRPKQVEGTMYKCETGSGASSYFNVPDSTSAPATPETPRRAPPNGAPAAPATSVPRASVPTPGFPRVDAETQKGRDDMRRRVLGDELAAEEKLLAEARALYADGAPPPLAEERTNADRYRERIARLRQTVLVHERNIEALKKELANVR